MIEADRHPLPRRLLRSSLAVLGAICAGLAGMSPPVAADEVGPAELTVVDTTTVSPRLHEVTFSTPALTHETTVRVLVPDGYDPEAATRYPVLYLLHGGGGSYRDWTDQGGAEAATAGLPLIVVMPDNNKHGNYVDWYNHGAFGPPMWETFIIGQLLPWVDATYRTTGDRDGRAVAGLSMGGGGAMGYAARHPDLFSSAAAFSGAVDTNTIPVQLLAETSGFEDGEALGAVFGHRITDEIRWRGHNPWDLAENLRPVELTLRTGNGLPGGPDGGLGDPVELAVWQMMTNLHTRLDALGIDHLWDDYGPGGHSWYYWARSLRQLLPPLMARFDDPVPAPREIDFKSIAAHFQVWGWDVAIDRPAPEFARLLGASASGFTLEGSGRATVTTPAVYEPGQRYRLDVVDAAGARSAEAVADRTGRLQVPVDLGAGNPHQQHTLEGNLWVLTAGSAAWPTRSAAVEIAPAPVAPDSGATIDAPPAPPAPGPSAPETLDTGGSDPVTRLPATGAGWLLAPAGILLAAALALNRVR